MSTRFVALIVAAALSILTDQPASADTKNLQISKDLIECVNQSEFYWELQNHAKIKEELSGAEAGRTEFYKWFAGQLKLPQLPTERQRTAETMRDSELRIAWDERNSAGELIKHFVQCVMK